MSDDADRVNTVFRESATADEPSAGRADAGDQPNPDRIVQLGQGYLRAKYLFVGVDVEVFQQLGTEGATLEEVAERCELPVRTARALCDALVLWGLLERDGVTYRNSPDAEAFLTDRGAPDLRPMLRYFDKLSYPTWADASHAWRTGQGVRKPLTTEENDLYEESVALIMAPAAAALPTAYDFTPHRRVLDAGGGIGTFLTPILEGHEHLTGTLLELPETADGVRGQFTTGPHAGRVEVVGADMFTDPIPDGHDVILLANVAHLFPPETNQTLLRRIRDVVAGGARLLILDWYSGPDAHPATTMISGEWLTMSGGGAYRVEDVDGWLRATGWRLVDHRPVSPPMSLLVAEAV